MYRLIATCCVAAPLVAGAGECDSWSGDCGWTSSLPSWQEQQDRMRLNEIKTNQWLLLEQRRQQQQELMQEIQELRSQIEDLKNDE
jgi:hypothetical protein